MSTTTIDWDAATTVAAQLGIHTRNLVADGDADAAREWAFAMSLQHGNSLRAVSYLELAVLLGWPSDPSQLDADPIVWLQNEVDSNRAQLDVIRDALAVVIARQDQIAAASDEFADDEPPDEE